MSPIARSGGEPLFCGKAIQLFNLQEEWLRSERSELADATESGGLS